MSFSSVGLGVGRTNLVSQSVAKGNTAAITAKIKTGPYWSSTDAPPSTEPHLNTGSGCRARARSAFGLRHLGAALASIATAAGAELGGVKAGASSRTPKHPRRLGPALLRMLRSALRNVDGVRQHLDDGLERFARAAHAPWQIDDE